jgi:hypothetical protein
MDIAGEASCSTKFAHNYPSAYDESVQKLRVLAKSATLCVCL